MYICTASIWTYDGNNLEALGAQGGRVSPARVYETTSTGDVLRVRRSYPQGRIRWRMCYGGGS